MNGCRVDQAVLLIAGEEGFSREESIINSTRGKGVSSTDDELFLTNIVRITSAHNGSIERVSTFTGSNFGHSDDDLAS